MLYHICKFQVSRGYIGFRDVLTLHVSQPLEILIFDSRGGGRIIIFLYLIMPSKEYYWIKTPENTYYAKILKYSKNPTVDKIYIGGDQ